MPTVDLLHRRRFVRLEGATARAVAPNAWEIDIPASDAVRKLVRDPLSLEAWDGAIFALDGRETEPAMASGADDRGVKVTVLVL